MRQTLSIVTLISGVFLVLAAAFIFRRIDTSSVFPPELGPDESAYMCSPEINWRPVIYKSGAGVAGLGGVVVTLLAINSLMRKGPNR